MTDHPPVIRRILAPNPGPDDAGRHQHLGRRTARVGPPLVVDPGPLDADHLRRVQREAGEVAVIVLTHRHLDHSEGASRFAELTGAGVRAARPAVRRRHRRL